MAAHDRFDRLRTGLPPAAAVRAAAQSVDALRRPTLDAQQALSFGVIPGGGQFYAHRITRGALSAVGAAAAVALAFQSRKTETPVEQTGTDPFGNPYTYTTNKITTDHPYMVPGLAVAGAITAISAIDAFLYVRRITAPPQRVSMSVFAYPHAVSVVARVTLP